MIGQLLGNVGGLALACAIVLIVPGQNLLLGALLGFSLTLIGGFLGRMAFDR